MSAAIRVLTCAAFISLITLASRLEAQNQGAPPQQEGLEVLMHGPLHEAFATSYSVNPAAGPVVAKEPPQPIEEVPPAAQPPGSVWIPGYWYWSDDDQSFLWISGVWRVPPPDRVWIAGYWTGTNDGYQWVPGFWSAEDTESVLYLPPPPDSLEAGPSSPRPGNDYFWIVGHWAWNDGRYLWQPGYWAQTQPGYVWYPDSYYWTPSGSVYLPGYWDYPFAQRGIPFAPVRFTDVVYTRPNYYYRPWVALNVGLLAVHLFVRPSGYNYYFGDYYGNDFVNRGYYPWYQRDGFRDGFRRGYDPLFTYYSNTDPNYLNVLDNRYQYFLRNERARPSRQFQNLIAGRGDRNESPMLAATLTQLTSDPELFTRNAVVAANEGRMLGNLARLRPLNDQESVVMRERANRFRDIQQRRNQMEAAARENTEPGRRGARRLDLANLIDRQNRTDIDDNRRDRNRDGRPDRGTAGRRTPGDRQEIEASQPNTRLPVTEANQPGPAGTEPPAPRTDRQPGDTHNPRLPGADNDRPTPRPGSADPGSDNRRVPPQRRPIQPGQPNENPNARPGAQDPSTPDRRPSDAAPLPTDRKPEARPNPSPRNPAEKPMRRRDLERTPDGRTINPGTRANPNENPNRVPPESRVVPPRSDRTPGERVPRANPPVRQPGSSEAAPQQRPQGVQPGIPDARRRQSATPSLPTRPDGRTPTVDSNKRGGPVLGPQQSPLQPRTRPTPPSSDFDLNYRLRPQSRRPGIDQGQQRPPGVNPQAQPGNQPQQNRQVPGLQNRERQRPDANRPDARRNRPENRGRPPAANPQPEPPKKDG